jgi:hypothetical protein
MREIDDDHVLDEGDGGPETPELNQDLGKSVLEIVALLTQDIFEIDLQLVKCKQALGLLQPMKSGRVDVRFWRRRTLPGRHPVVIKWRRLKAGLQQARRGVKQRRNVPGVDPEKRMWTADRLKVKRLSMQANRSRGFAETHPWVVEVLDLVQELADARAGVVEQLSALRRNERRWGQVRRDRVAEIGQVLGRKMGGYEAVAQKLKELNEQEAEEARMLVEEANEAQRRRTWVVRKKAD